MKSHALYPCHLLLPGFSFPSGPFASLHDSVDKQLMPLDEKDLRKREREREKGEGRGREEREKEREGEREERGRG